MTLTTSLPARIGFAGTPDFAASILEGLLGAAANIVCVYTQPDRPSGRGQKLVPCAVKQLANSQGIEVRQPKSLRKTEAIEELRETELDVLIVAAYGLILPKSVLDAPRLGCINVHASLLPRWRGAAPIERAIMAGDNQSGVCIMKMEAGLDTGGVYNQRTLPITNTTTGRELHDAMATPGVEALLETLTNFEPQAFTEQDDELATYAHKLETKDAEIDWHQSANKIARQINALNDRLPARTKLGDETIKLLRATPVNESPSNDPVAPGTITARSKKAITVATGELSISIREIQLNRGKGKPMPMAAALNGYAELFQIGHCFSSTAATANPVAHTTMHTTKGG